MNNKPLLVVGGKVYHYHELDIQQDRPEPEVDIEWQAHPMYRPVYHLTLPFHLTIKTYIAPAVRDSSIWLVRRWRAESYSRETYSGARLKPSRKRERIIFENAVEEWPVEHEIRRRTPLDLRPGWTLGNVRPCQYMEEVKNGYGQSKGPAILCHRPAVYVIMWVPEGLPVVEHFGYICDHHRRDFETYIQATQPNPSDYKLRRLHGGE